MLETIKKQLKKFPLQRLKPDANDPSLMAAVLLVLHGDPKDPEVILTQRAMHLKNHAGEVAFPGGMWDTSDGDLLDTALREAYEEIGLRPDLVEPIATLPVASPKQRNLKVIPFVGLVDEPLALVSDPAEIDAIFHVPVRQFTDVRRYQYFKMGTFNFPYLLYNEYRIWGFTLKVLIDMLNATLDAGVDLDYPSDRQIEQ